MMNFWYHDMENKITMIAVLLLAIFNGIAFHLLIKQNKIISDRQSIENLGIVLVTKVNMREKGCSNINMVLGDVSVGKKYRDKLMIGDRIIISDYGNFVVKSYGNHNSIDIYVNSLKEAKTHGAKRKRVYLIKKL